MIRVHPGLPNSTHDISKNNSTVRFLVWNIRKQALQPCPSVMCLRGSNATEQKNVEDLLTFADKKGFRKGENRTFFWNPLDHICYCST